MATALDATGGAANRTGRYALVAAILGTSIVFVDLSVVNVALVPIQRDLGGGLSAQQWWVDAYLLTLGPLILVGGSLGELLGQVRMSPSASPRSASPRRSAQLHPTRRR